LNLRQGALLSVFGGRGISVRNGFAGGIAAWYRMRGMITDTRRSMWAAWKNWTEAFPTGFAAEHPEMDLTCGGISVALFNVACPKAQTILRSGDLLRLAWEFGEILAPRNLPGLLVVRADRAEAIPGVDPILHMPGMVAGRFAPPKYRVGNFDIREAVGHAMAEEMARLNVTCHKMATEDVAKMTCAELWRAPNHGFLLYVEQAAVAAGSATFVEGISYVGWMATLPEFRGRGCAEAILRHMDAFMRDRYGATESVLHATEMGAPVYARLGYREVDRYWGYLCLPTGAA
jgi:GNAT superfamily N-acetyltransferase